MHTERGQASDINCWPDGHFQWKWLKWIHRTLFGIAALLFTFLWKQPLLPCLDLKVLPLSVADCSWIDSLPMPRSMDAIGALPRSPPLLWILAASSSQLPCLLNHLALKCLRNYTLPWRQPIANNWWIWGYKRQAPLLQDGITAMPFILQTPLRDQSEARLA